MKVAKERKSSVLASNAVHHRVDSLTSIVALLAIGGSHVLNGAAWLDPVGGLLVAIMVIQAGYGNTISAIHELCDKSVDEDIKVAVKKAGSKILVSSEAEIRDVQGTKAGQNYIMEIEVAVPDDWTLGQIQTIEQALRKRVGSKVRGVRRVRVRFIKKQQESTPFRDEFIPADVSPRSSPEPEAEEHSHDDNGQSFTRVEGNGVQKRR